jgi:hypothetical protein
VKSSYCIFAVRPKNFHFSSLKEIEIRLKSLKKFWLRIIWLVHLHSQKMGGRVSFEKGWIVILSEVKECQKIFESWEATARPDLSGQ